jgi:hypothetical protein
LNTTIDIQVALVMFGSYVYLGAGDHALDPAATFVCLSLICLLNYNVSTLPSSVNYIIQVSAPFSPSWQRCSRSAVTVFAWYGLSSIIERYY